MDSRRVGGPAYRQAGQTPKSLGLRIIRSLRGTFIVNETRLLLFLEHLGSIFKRCRPKSFSAGPPTLLDLAFPWLSITGKEMLMLPATMWICLIKGANIFKTVSMRLQRIGLGCKIFLVDEGDSLRQIPYALYERLLNGKSRECFPEYAGKRVRCIIAWVEMARKKPLRIHEVDYVLPR